MRVKCRECCRNLVPPSCFSSLAWPLPARSEVVAARSSSEKRCSAVVTTTHCRKDGGRARAQVQFQRLSNLRMSCGG
jgi:hypothetical protein